MAEMKLLSQKIDDLQSFQSIKKFLSDTVFSKNGQKIGKVKDIIFEDFNIIGIIIAKAKIFNKMFIDKEYIDRFTDQGIILTINPVVLNVKKKVFDSDGRYLGRVKKVNRTSNSNSFESLSVKKGIFSRQKLVYLKNIKVIEKNIILNTTLKNGR